MWSPKVRSLWCAPGSARRAYVTPACSTVTRLHLSVLREHFVDCYKKETCACWSLCCLQWKLLIRCVVRHGSVSAVQFVLRQLMLARPGKETIAGMLKAAPAGHSFIPFAARHGDHCTVRWLQVTSLTHAHTLAIPLAPRASLTLFHFLVLTILPVCDAAVPVVAGSSRVKPNSSVGNSCCCARRAFAFIV